MTIEQLSSSTLCCFDDFDVMFFHKWMKKLVIVLPAGTLFFLVLGSSGSDHIPVMEVIKPQQKFGTKTWKPWLT